jgi:hypothetical protein
MDFPFTSENTDAALRKIGPDKALSVLRNRGEPEIDPGMPPPGKRFPNLMTQGICGNKEELFLETVLPADVGKLWDGDIHLFLSFSAM